MKNLERLQLSLAHWVQNVKNKDRFKTFAQNYHLSGRKTEVHMEM